MLVDRLSLQFRNAYKSALIDNSLVIYLIQDCQRFFRENLRFRLPLPQLLEDLIGFSGFEVTRNGSKNNSKFLDRWSLPEEFVVFQFPNIKFYLEIVTSYLYYNVIIYYIILYWDFDYHFQLLEDLIGFSGFEVIWNGLKNNSKFSWSMKNLYTVFQKNLLYSKY